MWESNILTSHGGNSVRRIFTYVVSAFVAAFLWILIISPQVHAADASWSGSDITYNGQTYVPTKATKTSKPTLAVGTTFYQNLSITMSGGLAYSIYFPSGGPATASSAKYSVYNLDGNGNYTTLVTSQTISITPQNVSTTTTDATWTNGNIVYAGKTYNGNGTAALVSTGTNPPLPTGVKYYEYIDIGANKAYLIYFGSSSNPPNEKTATYITYDIQSGVGGMTWSNPSTAKSISITPVNGTSSTAAGSGSSAPNTCAIDSIGWVVCPISTFLATGMDHIFDAIKNFLVVKPLSTDTTNSLYKVWDIIRSIANVAFVIAFLIIIYSQITNVGITNYSIKKLLPRLIIAAILVNISYYICAIAVDISNILGQALQEIFIGIREKTAGANTNDVASWSSVTGFILSGGTAVTAAGIGIASGVVATGGSAGAAIILLLPILVGLLLAVLVALIVLAARQALIIILIITAPLAFVAYLLPNTEKWFERWRKWFMDMLVFFPIFSVIFGGSQLAGSVIIQNASDINVILLGMFVQVAPLVLTPLLVRFSGDIVGRVAGLVNNPKKGLLDRTRNWAQDRSQYLAARNMARTDPVRNRQVFRRYALGGDQRRRIREGRKAMYGAQSDATWANSADFAGIDQGTRLAQDRKTLGESLSEATYNRSKDTNTAIRNLDINVNNAKLDVENAKAQADLNFQANIDPRIVERRIQQRVLSDSLSAVKSTQDAQFEEFKAGRVSGVPMTSQISRMMTQSREDMGRIALNTTRNSMAQQVQQEQRTARMLANTEMIDGQTLRTYAGGIHAQGRDRALALALTEQHKARAESVANASAIIEHNNLNAAETLQIAQNISVKGIVVSSEIQEAAAKRVAANGHMPSIFELLESPHVDFSAAGNEDLRLSLVEALRGNSNRPKFIGAGVMDQLTQGISNGIDKGTLDTWIQNMILDGKLSAKELAEQDKDTLVRISQGISRIPRTPGFTVALGQLQGEITNLKRNAQFWDRAGERKSAIEDISRKI